MEKVPEGSVAVIESSTTGKVLSRMLSGKYEVHMVAPPERHVSTHVDGWMPAFGAIGFGHFYG